MKKKLSVLAAVAALALSACSPQAAATPAVSAAEAEKAIKAKLESAYAEQQLKVQSVRAAPVAGWYEVVVSGNQVVYTDAKGDYMMVGDLVDVASKKSLTEARSQDLSKVDYASLPLDMAVKEVRGNGALKVVVFSDPDCPFCKRLEAEFAKMTDLTIYNFMMPIASLHPQAAAKAEQIWCQPDRTAAWTGWMREGKAPPAVAACDNPVAQTVSLGEQLGFTGTPTIVFPNGKVQPGYMPAAQLKEVIAANQK